VESLTNSSKRIVDSTLLVTSCNTKEDKSAHGYEIPVLHPLEDLGYATTHCDGKKDYALAEEGQVSWLDAVALSRIFKSASGGALTRYPRSARSSLGADYPPARFRRQSPSCQ
jgi:hypothetical protein